MSGNLTWKDDVKIYEDVNWIVLAQDMIKWWSFCENVEGLSGSEDFLAS
jgi:hypothetical protein